MSFAVSEFKDDEEYLCELRKYIKSFQVVNCGVLSSPGFVGDINNAVAYHGGEQHRGCRNETAGVNGTVAG